MLSHGLRGDGSHRVAAARHPGVRCAPIVGKACRYAATFQRAGGLPRSDSCSRSVERRCLSRLEVSLPPRRAIGESIPRLCSVQQ
jgi:hypothetical protein